MNKILSASKLKTLQSCSWLFWCKYGDWKLPQKSNDGARRGQCVHSLFECLLKPNRNRKKYYDQIVSNKTIKGIPQIERFIRSKMKKEGILGVKDNKNQDNFEMIDQMILVGLLYDFYCESGELEKAETEFSFTDKKKGYSIRGFIDKISKEEGKLSIHDYKTSAKRFEGDELESNVQAMMYSLYAKRVRKMDSVVKFIFLRFPENPVQELKFNNEVLKGFEQYLSYISSYLDKFNLESAYSDFAADRPYPKDGEGFKGPLLCGYGKFPGHQNKKGEEYWVCEYKWPYDYYALIDKTSGETKQTSFTFESLVAKDNCVIEKRFYSGCPRHQSRPL